MVADRPYKCYITHPSSIWFLTARLGRQEDTRRGGEHYGVDWDAREGLYLPESR